MKFGNHTLRRADHIHEGDEVCFEFRSTGYVVESVETTAIGMIRHNHSTGSNSYWPNELLYVKDATTMLTITRDAPTFRPVTIRVESQDDLDKLCAIIDAVACNRINHTQQLIRAAVDFRNQLHTTINED